MAVDTLGHLLALHVTPANSDDRAEVGKLAEAVQQATGDAVELIYVDQGYTGERAAQAARAEGIELCVVKLDEAKKGFVLLPKRWVVERSFAWMKRSFSQDASLAAKAGRKGGQSVDPAKRSFSRDAALASEAGAKGGHASHGASHKPAE
jgi:general stress protein YciG